MSAADRPRYGQGTMKFLQMSLVFAHRTCNLSMYWLAGKDLQQIVEYSEMLLVGEMG